LSYNLNPTNMSTTRKTAAEWLLHFPPSIRERVNQEREKYGWQGRLSTKEHEYPSLESMLTWCMVGPTYIHRRDPYWDDVYNRIEAGEFDQPWVEPEQQDESALLAQAIDESMKSYGSKEAPDMVNHPPHYTKGGIECIDAIAAAIAEDTDPISIYLKGTVIKYLWRYQHKGGTQDLQKAAWHVEKLIARRVELEQN